MKKKFYPQRMIVPTLPKLLFEGAAVLRDKTPLDPPLPVYDPKRDHLSVVFVAMHKDGEPQTPCKNAPALSALPQHLFQWQPVTQGQNQAAFTESLRQWIDKSCRAQGHVSSSVLTERMILPYVQGKLAEEGYKDLQFSRTILVLLGNDAYYGGSLPSRELFVLKRERNVRDIEGAASSIEAVDRAFHIVTPPDWVFTIHPHNQQFDRSDAYHGNTLVYRLAKIQPLEANVDNYLNYPKQIRLDRIAISNNELQLIQKGGTFLRILPSDRLRAEKLELAFTNKAGKDWQIGQHLLPRSIVIDFDTCIKSKNCLQTDGIIYVPLLKIVIDPILASNDPEITPGQIRFKVRFRYNANEVYNHHYVDTDWKTIGIYPVKQDVIPKSQFFSTIFPEIVLDNKTLAAEYDLSQDSHGLTPKKAYDRIVAAREAYKNKVFFYVIIAAIIATLALLAFLLVLFYKRRFQPRLKWKVAKQIDIDFNQQPGAKLLVGTLIFINEGRVPWLGRLLRNKDYPDYQVEFTLGYRNERLINGGFLLSDDVGVPLGFRGVGEGTTLMRQMEHRVSHETPIYIFLATDVITDFQPHQTVSAQQSVTFGGEEKEVPISVDMWRTSERVATQGIEFDLELIPEQAKPPRVTYQTSIEEKIYFNKGKSLEIGTFRFDSQAEHHFARPFVGRFNLRSYKNNLPLPDNAVTLVASGEKNIVVSPNETPKVKIIALCDGKVIPNPEPPSQDYTFDLTGEFAPESAHGPHQFTLYRDPTRADIHLDIVQRRKIHRLHWQKQGECYDESPIRRHGVSNAMAATGDKLNQGILDLEPELVKFTEGKPPSNIFEIKIGNTGTSGDGWVKVRLTVALEIKWEVENSLVLRGGYTTQDLLHVMVDNDDFTGQPITVYEGKPVKTITVQLNAARAAQDIEGGRLGTDKHGCPNASLFIKAKLDIELADDLGNQRQHQCTIHTPIGLEKLPHENWLCIDFGTSAIVAAIGQSNRVHFLPLQKLVNELNRALNIGDYDSANLEYGTRFLPSYVVCDADLRQDSRADEKSKKGYPGYRGKEGASLIPGDPDFIGLPATTVNLRRQFGRVIYSLKSWLAQASKTIALDDEVTYCDKSGRQFKERQLPLDGVVQSGFAALAEAYISQYHLFEKGGQIVITHPNTFTVFHREKLHRLAWNALGKRLGIALKERIRLLSESDAVAYQHCQQRMANKVVTGSERFLVYDFGAGTLDLSLVNVQWGEEGVPKRWKIENRLGVPLAGNYLDSLLARLIDKWLRDQSVLDPSKYDYQYPIVGEYLKGDATKQEEHRLAIHRLWEAIRQLKQGGKEKPGSEEKIPAWDGSSPFEIMVGSNIGVIGIVSENGQETATAEETTTEIVVDDTIDSEVNATTDKPFIKRIKADDSGGYYFNLCIPAKEVHRPLEEFIEFVTETVVDELLQAVGVKVEAVDTVVVSGRGALWPGLRQRVWDKFKHIEDNDRVRKPDLSDSNLAKNAVVSGAIAWQQLSIKTIKPEEPDIKPRLAILRQQHQRLILEDEWDKRDERGEEIPIDLNATDSFELVQVSLTLPNPKEDFKSLRRHFYIRLKKLRRAWGGWDEEPRLYVKKIERDGQTIVRLSNAQGQNYDVTTIGADDRELSSPPWPIGNIQLPPLESEND